MASIHKLSSRKSPFWWAAFKGPLGKPLFRSTKTVVERDAWEIASKWEREAESLLSFPNQSAANLVLEEFISVTQLAAQGLFDEHVARKLINRLLELAECLWPNPWAIEMIQDAELSPDFVQHLYAQTLSGADQTSLWSGTITLWVSDYLISKT